MEYLEEFRQEVRAWLEANCPPSMRSPMPETETVWGGRKERFPNPEAKLWLDRMAAKGWTTPTWPKEYGGGGLSVHEARVLQEEMRRIQARPPLTSFGIGMLGPALLEFASEEQKRKYIPEIVRGEIRWCQGYSEPGAGSDLAGLQTRAADQGDHFLVNGSKIWTSYANRADWMFCLVRTDPEAPKHRGISFILFDMESPGVSTSPIRLISGNSPFCQTFLDDVRVPKENLVGPLNGGWTIAKRLLEHERTMIAGIGGMMGGTGGPGMAEVAKDYVGAVEGRIADSGLRDKVAKHQMDGRSFALTMRRVTEEAKQGHGAGAAASVLKYFGTEHNKRRYELLVSLLGSQGLGWDGDGFSERELVTARQWLRSKGNSIEGGTSEIQLNVIAKNVLGLPD
jgi:alkylation response protein AidB-like acyl-CoA dehydrogenase